MDSSRASSSPSKSSERALYLSMCAAVLLAVVAGFSRTFYLAMWFPRARAAAAQETIFVWHGLALTAWFLLLAVQPILIRIGRRDLHVAAGWFGMAVAASVLWLSIAGALTAARRPGGFTGVPMPPAQFLVVPFMAMTLYSTLVAAGFFLRRNPQAHKRLILLGSIAILDAATGRLPFAFAIAASPVPAVTWGDLLAFGFVLPIFAWDLATMRRPHPATLVGGFAILATITLRFPLSETQAWLRFASWVIG